jgi:hypothetical protein
MADQSKQPQIAISEALHLLQTFRGADLTQTIYQIEKSVKGVSAESYLAVLTTSGAKAEVLGAAGLIKQLAGQINVGLCLSPQSVTGGLFMDQQYPKL